MVGRRVLNAAAPANSFETTELKVEKTKLWPGVDFSLRVWVHLPVHVCVEA